MDFIEHDAFADQTVEKALWKKALACSLSSSSRPCDGDQFSGDT
jgi:hypothetical protein